MVNKKKINQQTFLAFFLFLTLGFLLVGIGWRLAQKLEESSFFNLPLKKKSGEFPPSTTSLIFNPSSATKKPGEELQISLVLRDAPRDVFSFALRVKCLWSNKKRPPVQIKGEKKLIPNQDLVNAGWQYLVNKIDFNQKGLIADLAAVYINPRGFHFNKDEVLASFYLKTITKEENLVCYFEPSLTKVFSRQKKEVPLEFQEGNYLILPILSKRSQAK